MIVMYVFFTINCQSEDLQAAVQLTRASLTMANTPTRGTQPSRLWCALTSYAGHVVVYSLIS
jgi:hypothetical protein